MKIHSYTMKRFMGISAATLLLLSVGGGAINATNHTHADVSLDSIMKAQDKKGLTKSDIAQEKEDYNYALTDAQKHPKHLSNDELGIQDNSLFHKKSFESAVKQGIKAKRNKANEHKNAHKDNFDQILDKASNEVPSKSDIADEKEQYDNAFNDAVKHPKELNNNELTLQDNYLFHKKSFEKAVRQAIHKRTPKIKRDHKAKQPKWKQVKVIKNSLKRINRKISRIARHKYRTKRTKRNARRTLNHLKQQLRNDTKQLNQLTHKHPTKRHKRVRKIVNVIRDILKVVNK